MIIVLDTTTRKLQAVMGAAAANYNCTVTVAYAETTASSFTEGMQPTTLAGLTVTDILAAPSVAATRRVVKAIMIYNNDTVTQTVTVYLDDNGTDYPLVKVTLGPGANWASDDQTGVNVGGGVTDGNKGDIVVGNSGATWNIRTDMPGGAVTLAKMADIATDRLIGRDTAGTGAPEAISVTGGIEFTGSGSLQVGAFSGEVEKTAGSSTLAITSGAVTPAKLSSVAQVLAFKNRLINGSFAIDQRNNGVTTSVADDIYCFDRWYILSQTSSVQVVRQTNTANGIPTNIRITQNQATAQRCGIAQIIESINCRDLRGQSVVLRFDLRCSASQAIRYAILEWTGTADSVTSDVVSSWTNGTFTTGQFFNSTSLTLVGTGSTTPSANTWTTATALTGTVSASANNLIVFIWSEGTLAQNATLDLGKVQLERGSTATEFEVLPITSIEQQCYRYFQIIRASDSSNNIIHLGFGVALTAQIVRAWWIFPARMRVGPSYSIYSASALNADFTWGVTGTGGTSYFKNTAGNGGVLSIDGLTPTGFSPNATFTSNLFTAGDVAQLSTYNWVNDTGNADASISFSAEL